MSTPCTPLLARLEGLKFPDEQVTRFFYKSGLHRRTGRVLELGCGNGNNLALFSGHGWECMGLDVDPRLLDEGRRNFTRLGNAPPRLEAADMNDPLPDFGAIDVLLLPSSLYYVPPERAAELIRELAPTLNPGTLIFCRFRTPEDYRYGKGTSSGRDSFRLTIDETAEHGCQIAFYSLAEMLDLLAPCGLDPARQRVMKLVFDNLGRDDRMIRNDELVLWARTHEKARP